jgi:hypothetical protein
MNDRFRRGARCDEVDNLKIRRTGCAHPVLIVHHRIGAGTASFPAFPLFGGRQRSLCSARPNPLAVRRIVLSLL